MTPFQQHVMKWRGCEKCSLCSGRKKMVFARGSVPCRVLFIGEAPGDSENLIGQPFVGPAGKLFDTIIRKALPGWTVLGENGTMTWVPEVTYALTNLVCCYPKEAKESGDHEPPAESIRACSQRLSEFVTLCHPELIVCVGSLATTWVVGRRTMLKDYGVLQPPFQGRVESVIHPAAILRQNIAMRGLSIQKCVVTIANALEEIL